MLLPGALGLADGILNALTLASASLVGDSAHVTVSLAFRIAVAALVTAGFAVFVAAYAEARGGLRHAARQLSMPTEESLLTTQLGRNAVRDACQQCLFAMGSSLLGALAPLLVAAALPGPSWIAAAIAIAALGALGVGLASVVVASRIRWALALTIGGVAVTAIGAWIHIAR